MCNGEHLPTHFCSSTMKNLQQEQYMDIQGDFHIINRKIYSTECLKISTSILRRMPKDVRHTASLLPISH